MNKLIPVILVTAVTGLVIYQTSQDRNPQLVTGKRITPAGTHVEVGSYPANMALSPDGKFVVSTNTGFRQFLSVIRTDTGKLVSQVPVNAARTGVGPDKQGLYWGLAWGPSQGSRHTLYASRGAEDKIAIYELDEQGTLKDTGRSVDDTLPVPSTANRNHPAGIAISADGRRLYVANNQTDRATDLRGSLSILSIAEGRPIGRIITDGFPFAVASVTPPGGAEKVYVTSERDGTVTVIDPTALTISKTIRTGEHPMRLLADRAGARLFVANASSDTVSVIDTRTDSVTQTLFLRPDDVRGLTGCSPTGLALSPDERTLYVTLADLNAVAIVDLPGGKLAGYMPTGWYPTAVEVSRDGKRLFVANAKGTQVRNPNGKPVKDRQQYIQNIVEGTVAMIDLPARSELASLTRQVLDNNLIRPNLDAAAKQLLGSPSIEHVIYVIKENRTYDQVLGDLKQGNGDPSLCLFPRAVTPNLHALAERFALLDNFYCAAEVSYDGWQVSTAGMVSEYTSRNAPYNYSDRGRLYDGEGQNNGIPVDLAGLRDVAMPGGGYFWDKALQHGISLRNYGFFVAFDDPATRGKEGEKTHAKENAPTRVGLQGRTDEDFRLYDTDYADSEAWVKHNAPHPKQLKEYGRFKAPSRFTEWKREFDDYVRKGSLPRLMLVRFGNDHTVGTSAGRPSPRAMVADNDYAVGQLVEAVSKSPFWGKTAICILEDDAQNGHDHVDAHRSIAFVISPWVRKGTVDSRFYNTDSMLRTMGLLLGIPPLCQYDAVASPIAVFGAKPDNSEPYSAILPSREIVAEINQRTAYRANDSQRLFHTRKADTGFDDELNDILWGAIKGPNPTPAGRWGLKVMSVADRERAEEEEVRLERRTPRRKLGTAAE